MVLRLSGFMAVRSNTFKASGRASFGLWGFKGSSLGLAPQLYWGVAVGFAHLGAESAVSHPM